MPRPDANPRADLYGRITDKIIQALEAGVRPWTRPWSAEAATCGPVSRPLRHDGSPYHGINVLLLWSEATAKGYASPIWMTFRQALALGGCVRRGETGAMVVYADRVRRTEVDDAGEAHARSFGFLKAYTVFNLDQIEGLDDRYRGAPVLPEDRRIAAAEAFFGRLGVDVRHGGEAAFYAAEPDYVQLPAFGAFSDAEAYYATLGHECIHWTRHPSRLDRDLGRQRWGDAGYAREELVAELGAAFLCADLSLALEPRLDHADYIAGWLEVLRQDRRFVVNAAAHAQKACDFLHGLQG